MSETEQLQKNSTEPAQIYPEWGAEGLVSLWLPYT